MNVKKSSRLLESIYKNKPLSTFLYLFSRGVSGLAGLLYTGLFLYLLIWEGDYTDVLALVLSAGVPFFIVGFVRRLINAKRPYEVYDFYTQAPKRKFLFLSFGPRSRTGESFPSRHAYSAFVISTLFCFFDVRVGVVLAVLSLLMCVCRVLLGIHFIRDIVAGAAVGIAAGVLGGYFIIR